MQRSGISSLPRRVLYVALCFLIGTVISAKTAVSAPIPVVNQSFEDNDSTANGGTWIDGVPYGWTSQDGTAGTLDPPVTGSNGLLFIEDIAAIGVNGGADLQYLGIRPGGYVYQDLGVTWQANMHYTVDLQLGRRGGANNSIEFGLWDSGSIIPGSPGADLGQIGTGNTANLVSNEFTLTTDLPIGSGNSFSFTTGATPPTGNVVVYLENVGAGNAVIDDVRVDVDVPPPPMGYLTATANRETGEIIITNPSTVALPLTQLSISSPIGALDLENWTSITGNYDGAGDGSVSSTNFSITTQDSFMVDESGNGSIAAGQSVSLGSLWAPYPTEDISLIYDNGDEQAGGLVTYTGNNDTALQRGDFNRDGSIDGLDWPTVRDNYGMATSGTIVENYYMGDLNNSGSVDLDDLRAFEVIYDTANGAGAFSAIVPEPGAITLLGIGGLMLLGLRNRRSRRIAATVLAATVAFSFSQDTATAAPLPILNAGFEDAASELGGPTWSNCIDIECNSGSVDPEIWQDTGPDGMAPLNNANSFSEVIGGFAADGTVHLGIALGGQVQQTLPGQSLQPNTVYTLTAAVGQRGGGWNVPNNETRFGLGVGGAYLSPLQTFDASTIPDSTFVDRDYVYITGPTVPTGDIQVMLGSTGAGRGHFDNLRLDATPIADYLPTFSNLLSLQVDPATGATALINKAGFDAVDIDFYEVQSSSGAINVTGWNSLQDQDYEGNGAAGAGNGWEELGTPSSSAASEYFLTGSSNLTGGTSISLGNLFNPSGTQDLQLLYKLETGQTFSGPVIYESLSNNLPCDYVDTGNGCNIDDINALYAGTNGAPTPLTDAAIADWLTQASSPQNVAKAEASDVYRAGDTDLNGDVLSNDLGVLLNNFLDNSGLGWGSGNFNSDTSVNSTDLGALLNNFGFTSASASSAAAVPEPNAFALFGLAGLCMLRTLRRKR